MARRIEVATIVHDARAKTRLKELGSNGFSDKIKEVGLVDVYTVDADLGIEDAKKVKSMLTNPVIQTSQVDAPHAPDRFDYAVEIGFLPGVTDNVGTTVREEVQDLIGADAQVHSSQVMFLSGNLTREDAQRAGESIANPLIQRIAVKSYGEFRSQGGMGTVVPQVRLRDQPAATLVDLLGADDDELTRIGKQGIANADGSRRGPLALDLAYMKAIRDYFVSKGRNPTDVELESTAQTWSEHCKHTIFRNSVDEVVDGLFTRYIRGATEKIRATKGKDDFCVSVFTDNSGAIRFDDNHLVTHKVETHNSPSALDPFGGSITGIVGVNRDAMGFGMGAKPVANIYGFCFGDPEDEDALYKGPDRTQRMLSSRRIMEGVIAGVNAGGNQSGIPTPQGFMRFDSRFKGKPLVFVGTVGLIPNESNGVPLYEKQARPGDYIVMVGGRVGKDGIHGATFSSEAMDSGSPATAVQIGDPITQKKMSDALVKETRDRGLYTSITDNGAGGLSCSVAEMAKESGGCRVDLTQVPVKYPRLQPWEIWISESQERMTLAVPPEKWSAFYELMHKRGVEATVIGEFTDSGKCQVTYGGTSVMDMDMQFLHDGLPERPMTTTFKRITHEEPDLSPLEELTSSLHGMLRRKNIASGEFVTRQYDHEVQAGSALKPLQGKGQVNADATVVRPVLDSRKGVVLSHGINPEYSDIDTYHMAAAAIDTAVRNAVATGASLDKIAILDNFCWCSSHEPERLGQLKRAVEACHDTAIAYGTPFISGKDSMFNDFKGFDHDGKPIKISVPPTLLASSIAVVDDVERVVSLDAKVGGDVVYLIGATHNELGGSEYFAMQGEETRGKPFIGNAVPLVDSEVNARAYRRLSDAIGQGLVASAQSLHRGGLGVALAKTAMGGKLGMDIDLTAVPTYAPRDDFTLYSESQGRILVTVDPLKAPEFERAMGNTIFSRIGAVRDDANFVVTGREGRKLVSTTVDDMLTSYKSTFEGY